MFKKNAKGSDSMPYIRLEVSKRMNDKEKETIKKEVAKILEEEANKLEKYLMISIFDSVSMYFAGIEEDTVYMEIKLLGKLSLQQKEAITKKICNFFKALLYVETDKMYVIFNEMIGENWGCNGKTYAD